MKIKLYARNTIHKHFDKPKFRIGDNYLKVIEFSKTKDFNNVLFVKSGTFKRNQKEVTYNCFNYLVELIN